MTQRIAYECPGGAPFPVVWPDADLSRDEWRWDQVHNPTPLTPLSQDLISLKRRGMYRGGETTGRPFNEERMYSNGYGFSRSLKGDPADAKHFRAIAERDSAVRIDRLLQLWESSYRPESEALTRSIRTWASPGDSLPYLLQRLDEVEAAWQRLGELHTLSTGLAGIAMRDFEAFCRDEFGDDGPRIAVESITGMPNKSVESAEALWELSREIAGHSAVADLLRARTPEQFFSDLDSVKDGPEIRLLLARFMDVWGQRNESYYEIAYPTWREEPGFVLSALRAYLDAPDENSPAVLHMRAEANRVARTDEARKRLSSPGKINEFLTGQRRAQQHTILMEDHNFYIDQRGYSTLRIPFLAIGERLMAGRAVDNASDVFYLHLEEIKGHAGHPDRTYEALVSERRASRESWMHVLPPPVIGGDAPRAGATPASDDGLRSPNSIQGLAASAGRVAGPARLILSLEDAHRLSPGDVLVTYATAPPWTPLFAIAAAVVTDAGGPLAHCAVVAREYGIPAVVGTKSATARIADGMLITVDGTTGVVEIRP
ncbi:MAG: PEP-utilizing enzyme [Chloroflexi bacterium]|nr:PEP-utilizing enzyme [Chloroflexota bacterium]